MLEHGSTLRTWRLLSELVPGVMIEAESSFDHRLLYLDYEGPISDNRGYVTRWDSGTFTLIQQSNTLWRVSLNGERCRGEVLIQYQKENYWTVLLKATNEA